MATRSDQGDSRSCWSRSAGRRRNPAVRSRIMPLRHSTSLQSPSNHSMAPGISALSESMLKRAPGAPRTTLMLKRAPQPELSTWCQSSASPSQRYSKTWCGAPSFDRHDERSSTPGMSCARVASGTGLSSCWTAQVNCTHDAASIAVANTAALRRWITCRRLRGAARRAQHRPRLRAHSPKAERIAFGGFRTWNQRV